MFIIHWLVFLLVLPYAWVTNPQTQQETMEMIGVSRHLAGMVPFRLTAPTQVGQVRFQTSLDFSVDSDEEGMIYISSPDGAFGMVILPKPVDYFEQNMIPFDNGGRFPEESIPIDMFYYLGYVNIQLDSISPYQHEGFRGFTRSFIARSDLGDLMEGEYLFYEVGENVFFAIGSSVQAGIWDRSKPAFDVIVASMHFPMNLRQERPHGAMAETSGNHWSQDIQVSGNPGNLSN